eukprot:7496354-Alexandrium_andersonii.AAC.1
MSASLVGSEMCIRDSVVEADPESGVRTAYGFFTSPPCFCGVAVHRSLTVSYTHLTLPTIWSV